MKIKLEVDICFDGMEDLLPNEIVEVLKDVISDGADMCNVSIEVLSTESEDMI